MTFHRGNKDCPAPQDKMAHLVPWLVCRKSFLACWGIFYPGGRWDVHLIPNLKSFEIQLVLNIFSNVAQNMLIEFLIKFLSCYIIFFILTLALFFSPLQVSFSISQSFSAYFLPEVFYPTLLFSSFPDILFSFISVKLIFNLCCCCSGSSRPSWSERWPWVERWKGGCWHLLLCPSARWFHFP